MTPSQKVERYETKEKNRKAKEKAVKYRLAEGATFVAGTALIGGLEARFPTLQAFGPSDRLNLGLMAGGVGLVALIWGKGYTREVGTGLLYAGAYPLIRSFGERILGPSE